MEIRRLQDEALRFSSAQAAQAAELSRCRAALEAAVSLGRARDLYITELENRVGSRSGLAQLLNRVKEQESELATRGLALAQLQGRLAAASALASARELELGAAKARVKHLEAQLVGAQCADQAGERLPQQDLCATTWSSTSGNTGRSAEVVECARSPNGSCESSPRAKAIRSREDRVKCRSESPVVRSLALGASKSPQPDARPSRSCKRRNSQPPRECQADGTSPESPLVRQRCFVIRGMKTVQFEDSPRPEAQPAVTRPVSARVAHSGSLQGPLSPAAWRRCASDEGLVADCAASCAHVALLGNAIPWCLTERSVVPT
mmetsp:Transcript_27497/g.71340  ORF Transcript_27497/g.71340 Transcript_27497/m.71340 type:complete len:320 (+) Transcript_27497:88-1047(+)